MTKKLQKRHFLINGSENTEGYVSEEPENIYFTFHQMQEITKIINNNTTYSLLQKDFYFQFLNSNKTVETVLRGVVMDIGNGDLDTLYNFNGFGLIDVEMINKKIRKANVSVRAWNFEGYIEDGYYLEELVKTIGFEKEEALQVLKHCLEIPDVTNYYTGFYFDEEEYGIVIEDDNTSYGYMFIAPTIIENEEGKRKEIYFIGEWGWKWKVKNIEEENFYLRKKEKLIDKLEKGDIVELRDGSEWEFIEHNPQNKQWFIGNYKNKIRNDIPVKFIEKINLKQRRR
jgi:hypothetical protein